MRRRKRPFSFLSDRAVIGLLISLGALWLMSVSYDAQKGLPLQPIVKLSVDVEDAKQLNPGSQVRIGGARVGFVESIKAENPKQPFARIEIAIFGDPKLPIDSSASITPISILGGKSVQLARGNAEQVFSDGGRIPLSRTRPSVDLNDWLTTFDPVTRRGLRGLIRGAGDGFAGRGPAFNETLAGIRPLLPPAQRVFEVFASPRTDVAGFISGASDTMSALRPVAGLFPEMLSNAAATFEAIEAAEPAFGNLIGRLPRAESASTRTLIASRPVLEDLAALTRELRPGAVVLPRAARSADVVLREGPATFALTRRVAPGVGRVVTELNRVLPPRSESLRNALHGLDETARTVTSLMSVLLPAQLRCNVLGVALQNNSTVFSESDANGGWINLIAMFGTPLSLLRSESGGAHRNYQPIADDRGCTLGKETFANSGQEGNGAAPLTFSHEDTNPPAIATQRARAAGLLTPTPGTRLP